jgi:hypothetical protein
VQLVDPNEVNELDREASVESSWLNYLLWALGAALTAAFAMWFFSRMKFMFARRGKCGLSRAQAPSGNAAERYAFEPRITDEAAKRPKLGY